MRLASALPFYTEASDRRMIGNCVSETPFGSVVGFENHSGQTFLADTLTPLGKILSGFGNNGEDGTEGVLYKNTFGTYAHGPVLPKNPQLADEILRRAVGNELAPLDDALETRCHDKLIKRFTGKQKDG